MNPKQKKAIFVGIALIVLMGLFPPWQEIILYPNTPLLTRPAGYHFILNPPESGRSFYTGYGLDFLRITVQFIVIGAATAGVVLFLKDK